MRAAYKSDLDRIAFQNGPRGETLPSHPKIFVAGLTTASSFSQSNILLFRVTIPGQCRLLATKRSSRRLENSASPSQPPSQSHALANMLLQLLTRPRILGEPDRPGNLMCRMPARLRPTHLRYSNCSEPDRTRCIVLSPNRLTDPEQRAPVTALPAATAVNRIWTRSEVDSPLTCFKNPHLP